MKKNPKSPHLTVKRDNDSNATVKNYSHKQFSVTFFQRNAQKSPNKDCVVYATLNHGGNRLSFSTGIICSPRQFDNSTLEIKGDASKTRLLIGFKNKANESYTDLKFLSRPIDLDIIKAYTLGLQIQNTPTVLECTKIFFEKVVSKQYQAGVIEKSSFDKLRNWTNKVVEYVNTNHGKSMALSAMVPVHANDYQLWLRTEKGISNDPSMAMTEYFKRVLKYAHGNKWIDRNPFADFRKKLLNTPCEYLTAMEVKVLEHTVIQSPVLCKVLDILLMQCYTGMAYAEIKALNGSHIKICDGQKYISILRKKTRKRNPEPCIIPLTKAALSILSKYQKGDSFGGFEVQSNQKLNNYLKEIAVIAGIKKRLRTHIGRHTFGEYCLNDKGMRIELVAKIMGHSTVATTSKHYARVREETILREALPLMG